MVVDIEHASRKDLENKCVENNSLSRLYFIVTAAFALAALLCLWALGEVDAQRDIPLLALIRLVPNGNHLLGMMVFSSLVALIFLILSLDIRQSSRITKLALMMRSNTENRIKKVKR